ncbi:MAG: hypothetical protein HY245_12280 [Rhizobiales bacterium]|nr:hypothetical protein [Hyphomicrobiales bacterium]MBI3674166.1 hypothetical protein [Hyphomicrobiales bacterium]
MFAKGTLWAGLLLAVLVLMPGAASAKTKVHIGVGIGVGGGGSWCNYHPYQCDGGYWGYPYPYNYWRPGYDYGPGYYLGGDYEDGYGRAPDRISCGEAKSMIYEQGFRNVRTLSCGGKFDSFAARRDGRSFVVKVNTWNGRIIPYRQ